MRQFMHLRICKKTCASDEESEQYYLSEMFDSDFKKADMHCHFK